MSICRLQLLNTLPNDNIMDKSKLKAVADYEINVIPNMRFVFHTIENVLKMTNAGFQQFHFF